jgi:hypothetical protein
MPWWLYSTSLTDTNMAVDCLTLKLGLWLILRSTDNKPNFMFILLRPIQWTPENEVKGDALAPRVYHLGVFT